MKDNKPVAYLFGFSNYYINIPTGEYTKSEIDKMKYTFEERELGNSAGTPETYMYYEFTE
ncbi:hypothetical protein [Brassicibacter mesophilus]|uniref:hypothetical protein n=1 Tax=Brassicibacter mesophilus TaxID=745119 RepID=UPI003D200CB5